MHSELHEILLHATAYQKKTKCLKKVVTGVTLASLGHDVFRGLDSDEDGVEDYDGQDGEAEPARLHQVEGEPAKPAPARSYQLPLFFPAASTYLRE